MGRSGSLDEADIGSECIATGDHACVWLFGEALREWNAVGRRNDENSRRAATRMRAYFERFAAMGSRAFPEEHFKTLGRFRAAGGNEYLILEFKAYQFRIYGIERRYRGSRAFLGLACDPAKQDNKADRKIIKRAANAADNIGTES